VQITLDRYGHLMDQSYGEETDKLEAALFGGKAASALQAPAREPVPQPAASGASGPLRLA
jgi:hypothetical protein